VDARTTRDSTPELTGTVNAPNAAVTVTVGGADYAAVNHGDGTWTLADDTVAALADGTYNVTVTASINGLENTDKTVNELKVDTMAPVVAIHPMDPTSDTRPEITGTVSDPNAAISVAVNGESYAAVNNGDGTWTLAGGTILALDEGTYDVVVTARDVAGNEGTAEGTLEIQMPPVVTVHSLTTNQTRPELTGTVDDPEATITVNVHGADYDAVNNGDGTWTLAGETVAALAEGTYDVIVTATDPAGNEATDSTVNELVVDTTAPRSVTINKVGPTNDTSPRLTGTVSDASAKVTVSVGARLYNAVNNGDGTWTLADNVIDNLPEGTYDAVVTATDAAGNSRTDETTEDIIIETSAPVVTVAPLTTTYTSPELTGTINDPDATVDVLLNGTTYTAVNNGDGTWTLEAGIISGLSTGTYGLAVSAVDVYGNVGTDTTLDELRIRAQTTVTMDGDSVRTVYYQDPDGTKVRIRLNRTPSRPGLVSLSFASNSLITVRYNKRRNTAWVECDAGALLTSLSVLADTYYLGIYTAGGFVKGATLNGISGSAVLYTLNARWITLLDGGINMPDGAIRSLSLRSIRGGDVTMFGLPLAAISLKVYESIEGANIHITDGDIRSMAVGKMVNSSVYVGVMGVRDQNGDGVNDLPNAADFRDSHEIKRFTITGYSGAYGNLFVNSNLAADRLGTVSLKNAELENQPDTDGDGEPDEEHEPFGLTANSLRSLSLRQGRTSYRWRNGAWLKQLDPLDLEVRLP
jgi:hypothetical protein